MLSRCSSSAPILRQSKTKDSRNSRPTITLTSGDWARGDAEMEVGELTQTVEVTGAAPAPETDTSTIGGLVTEQAVQDLALTVATLSTGRILHRAQAKGTRWDSAPGRPG
jgi:hypothetical protein